MGEFILCNFLKSSQFRNLFIFIISFLLFWELSKLPYGHYDGPSSKKSERLISFTYLIDF